MSRVPQSHAELCAMPAPRATHVIELLADDPRFGLKAGDQFEAHPYVMDPGAKWTPTMPVGHTRIADCNLYRSKVRVVRTLCPHTQDDSSATWTYGTPDSSGWERTCKLCGARQVGSIPLP